MERLAGRVILLWGWRRAGLAFLAGALAVLAQAPFDFPAVCLVSFSLLVWLLDGAAVRGPAPLLRRFLPFFAVGWWFGFGYFLAGLWWIGAAVLVDAGSFAWALPFAVLGPPLVLAVFFGVAAVIARLFWSDDLGRVFALALGFGIAEWLRGWVLTGLPWNPVGFAAMPVPLLMQSARVVGATAMNALAVLVFSLPALLGGGRHVKAGLALAALLVAAHAGYGAWRLQAPEGGTPRTLSVRIVQPAIDLSEKWDGAVRDRVFATTLDLSRGPGLDGLPPALILWPETAVPFLFTERPDALSAIGAMLADGQLLLAGAVRAEGDPAGSDARYYNAIVAVDSTGVVADAVDKVHLVPFGEYVPFAGWFSRLGVTQFVAGPMDFAAGAARHALSLPGGIKGMPFICYEVIFPDEVGRDVGGADLLVNITNDAWFGDTPGPYQHFRQLQLRAVENGLPAIRAANNGISGVIDSRGRVLDALALDARGRIDAELVIPPPDMPLFPATRVGLAAFLAIAAAAMVFKLKQGLQDN